MKNFSLGFLLCLCLALCVLQSYLVFCPHSDRKRDIQVNNSMVLPYDGFILKPLFARPVFPFNNFPIPIDGQEQDENSEKDNGFFHEKVK